MDKAKRKRKIVLAAVLVALAAAAAVIAVHFAGAGKETVYIAICYDYHYESLEELAADSDLIALVRVSGVEDVTIGSVPYPCTVFAVQVITPVYNAPAGEEFLISMPGGETKMAVYQAEDDPLPHSGDEMLVFCSKSEDGTYCITGGPQGRFPCESGQLRPLNAADEAESTDADEMIAEIKSYLQ